MMPPEMRVVMLLRNPFTRDARVLREARTLAAAGHAVTVIAVRARGLPAMERRDGFAIDRAVAAGRLAGPTITGQAAGPAAGGAMSRRRPAAGGAMSRRRPASAVWLRDRTLTRSFTRAALARPADVYHAHDLTVLEPALRAARAHGARLVYDAHELYPELTGLAKSERARWARLERRLIREPDVVIVPSPARADAMAERYGIERPVVIMNAPEAGPVPDPAASPLAVLRQAGETLLVYAGGFTPNRGLENVVRALEALPTCRLTMIGWGPLEPELRAVAARSGAEARVEFLPAVEPDQVVATIAGADIGLAPYIPIGLNNQLAAPNKLAEYLHAGLAVAASDLPDVRALVQRHAVGTLFDATSPTSIAAAIGELLEPGRLEKAKAAARAAAPGYTWERQAEVLLGVYEKLRS